MSGNLDVMQDLRAHDIQCTSDGANRAAWSGLLAVIRDLHTHGIHCTSRGADWAATKGHLAVIQELRAQGIYCTSNGAEIGRAACREIVCKYGYNRGVARK